MVVRRCQAALILKLCRAVDLLSPAPRHLQPSELTTDGEEVNHVGDGRTTLTAGVLADLECRQGYVS